MNVFITGGLGFVGGALANRFSEEHRVTVLARSLAGLGRLRHPDRVSVRHGALDSLEPGDLEGIDLVFHCASTVDNYNILSDPLLDTRTNCEGTIRLLEACKEHKPRLVYVSTFFVYGDAPDLPVDELSPCAPRGLYPATKLCAEQFCFLYGRLYGMHVNVCRLTNVYGPGEAFDNPKKGAINYLIHRAYTGEELRVYDGGDVFRDYLYLDDAVAALSTVGLMAPPGELYLVGSGERVYLRELIDHAHRLTGRRSAIVAVPPPRFHEVVGITNFAANTAKTRALGWLPRVGVEEGIRRVLSSYG